MVAEHSKRIGVFVTGAFSSYDRLDSVSGHVQIPLMAAGILHRAGHDVTLITTKERGTHCLPFELPTGLEISVVQHASGWSGAHRIYAGKAIKQVLQLLTLMKRQRFDIVHFFGGAATGWLLCTLKFMGVPSAAFYSPIKGPPSYRSRLRRRVLRSAFRQVGRVLATSDCVSAGWAPIVGEEKVRTMYPGVVRQHKQDVPGGVRKDSVLFWRCARYDNGVDVAMASFRKLAPEYPGIRFVFAVRPHDRYEDDLLKLGREIENIDVHVYPYGNGISLPMLLARAFFVVQPFRQLSINPQLSIIESLYAGVPVIATEVESNEEVVCHEESGLLIPPGDEGALSSAIQRLLTDTELLARLARNARRTTERRWNWDSFGQQLLRAYEQWR
jgi:glycosyltransferase involved in cell wall biosynthesis